MLECEERTIERLNRIPGAYHLLKGLEILKLTRMIADKRENFRLFTISNSALTPAPLLHFLFKRWETKKWNKRRLKPAPQKLSNAIL